MPEISKISGISRFCWWEVRINNKCYELEMEQHKNTIC